MHALCPPLPALCLMSLALCGPVWFYLLFVSNIWWWIVSWFVHVLLPSCVICKKNATLWKLVVCLMHALCPPLPALGLMSLALGGPVGFYLLFVPNIWGGIVSWFVHVLLPSCVICKKMLHSGNLMCASCMPSALHSLPSASCHLLCVVLQGFTFCLRLLVCFCALLCYLLQ